MTDRRIHVQTRTAGDKTLYLNEGETVCNVCHGAGCWDSCFDCGNRGYFPAGWAQNATELCHCGQPLHYTDPKVETYVRKVIEEQGEYLDITTPEGTYRVQRHFIALHGIKSRDLPTLGFEKVSTP
jgi:hypothetical protein